LVAAAVCPHPPVLVPEIASGAAAELEDLRTACHDALATLNSAGAHQMAVIGKGPRTRQYGPDVTGTFAPWGVPLPVRIRPARGCVSHELDSAAMVDLPLSLLVGAWLLAVAEHPPVATMMAVAPDTPAAQCASLGAQLLSAGSQPPLALLVMGDGSACRSDKAPGYHDPRAEGFDATVVRALATADPAALLALDGALSDELVCGGRVAWQALAGAAMADGGTAAWGGTVLYDAAPYGVQYTVATWTRQPGAGDP
jgi:hypothetical protein